MPSFDDYSNHKRRFDLDPDNPDRARQLFRHTQRIANTSALELWPLIKSGKTSCLLLKLEPHSATSHTAITACKRKLPWPHPRQIKLVHRDSTTPCPRCLNKPLGKFLQGHELTHQQTNNLPHAYKLFYGLLPPAPDSQTTTAHPELQPGNTTEITLEL